jgi:hypothetical protein
MGDTIYDLACSKIRDFDDFDAVMKEHLAAMDCRGCEEFLEFGLNAFKWLISCDEAMHEADAQGLRDYRGALYDDVTGLFRMWQRRSQDALAWIARLEQRGYTPDNVSRFHAACEAVAAIVEDRDWHARSSATFHALAED